MVTPRPHVRSVTSMRWSERISVVPLISVLHSNAAAAARGRARPPVVAPHAATTPKPTAATASASIPASQRRTNQPRCLMLADLLGEPTPPWPRAHSLSLARSRPAGLPARSAVPADNRTSTFGRKQVGAYDTKKAPQLRGFPSAPERTRTSTDHSVHKALNLDRPLSMLRVTSTSTNLRVCVDAWDGLEVADAG